MLHKFSYKRTEDDEISLVYRRYACAAIDLNKKFDKLPGLLPALRLLLEKRDTEVALIRLKREVSEVN